MELERDEGPEERGYFFQKLVTDKIILCHPPLNVKVYKKIMYDFSDQLIFIKKNEDAHTDNDYIPCLFYRKKEKNLFFNIFSWKFRKYFSNRELWSRFSLLSKDEYLISRISWIFFRK